MKKYRRVHVSREVLRQCEHHLKEYHKLFCVWSLKTVEQTPHGVEREKLRQGLNDYFNEIQCTLAVVQQNLGMTPKSIQEALEQMDTPEYRRVIDKVKVQAQVYKIKQNVRFWKWPGLALDWFLTLVLSIGKTGATK